jgi:hypothetical protein
METTVATAESITELKYKKLPGGGINGLTLFFSHSNPFYLAISSFGFSALSTFLWFSL